MSTPLARLARCTLSDSRAYRRLGARSATWLRRGLSTTTSSKAAKAVVPAEARAVTAAIREAEESLSTRDHLMRLGLWAFISLNIGAFFSQGDEGAQVLLHLDEFTDAILDTASSKSKLTEALERVSRGTPVNDTLKMRLLATPGFFDRLVEISGCAAPGSIPLFLPSLSWPVFPLVRAYRCGLRLIN
mmetsp:Transcript_80835/g.160633  ORF Transcript_80835/g.160633 Transcript_80835/m.160633 type:complete len:188 (+) Transcript_80835:104-667(+)